VRSRSHQYSTHRWSQVYSSTDYVAADIDEVVDRVKTTHPNMTAVHYEMLVVNEELVNEAPLRSARSPLRDRSVFYLPRKETSSYTTYRNACEADVRVWQLRHHFWTISRAFSAPHSPLAVFYTLLGTRADRVLIDPMLCPI